jgi:DsrE/DsrF-like family
MRHRVFGDRGDLRHWFAPLSFWCEISGVYWYRRDAGRRTLVVKVAYVFSTSGHTASYKLGKMILPQLEQGIHGVEVVGLFFFDDNNYILRKGDPIGERLARVAAEKGILLMMCDQCAVERGLAEGEPGAFPSPV